MDLILKPECLRWARERAGFSISELAERLGLNSDKILDWEKTGEITLSRAERLAEKTHTPFGYLFLSEPPTEVLPIQDFRTVSTQDIPKPSVDLLDVINDAIEKQDWYRDYLIANGAEVLGFVGSLKVSKNIVKAAELIRKTISWEIAQVAQPSSWENALAKFIETIRDAGVLVMRSGIVGNNTRRKLKVNEFRGFSLADGYAPLVFINGNDAKAAQMFTLAHELVHIWLGESGISNLRLTYSPDIEIELFCNAVAAEFLVPAKELKKIWDKIENSFDSFSLLARQFKVSKLVILRRLRDLNKISVDRFETLYTDELAQINQRDAKVESGGGDFYTTTRARFGDEFLSALLGSTIDGTTTYREALEILGVSRIETINNLASQIGIMS